MLDIFSSNRQDAATSPSTSTSPPAPLLPIIFCGPGSNLYPLCDPSSSSPTESLPKAVLPVANRPLIAYSLQHLVSAGFKRILVVAPSTQHRVIESALKSIRLQVPHIGESKATAGGRETSGKVGATAGSDEATTNIFVVDGLATGKSAAVAPSSNASVAPIRVELIPLGPYDVKAPSEIREDYSQSGGAGGDTFELRRVARPGTAELLRWLAHIGKLESDPLVFPVDFIAPSLPLSSFLLSYYTASHPAPPTVTSLLYERGAGESVGREREKEAPPRMLAACSHSFPVTSSSSSDTIVPSSSSSDGLSVHSLLLLSELPTGSTLDVRLSLLKAYPRTRFTTNLLDSHIYILRRDQIIPLLNVRKDFTSLREHVVPFVAKAGWQTGLVEKVGWGELLREQAKKRRREEKSGYEDLEDALGDISIREEAGGLMQLAFQRGSMALVTPPRIFKHTSVSYDPIRAVTVVARLQAASDLSAQAADQQKVTSKSAKTASSAKGGSAAQDQVVTERFFARANTLPTYLESNRFLLRVLSAAGQALVATGKGSLPFPLPALLPPNTSTAAYSGGFVGGSSATPSAAHLKHQISPSAQLSPDTLIPLVGSSTADEDFSTTSRPCLVTISDRTSLKRSLLSSHVHLSRNVKISGSIMMEGSVIGEGSKLENCILGPGAKVGEGCVLKDVDMGPGARVASKKDVRGEKIAKGEEDGQGQDDDDEGESGGGSGEESD